MIKLLLILISLTLSIIPLKSVEAHAGGGPPFVMVNDQYALTNPIFQNAIEASQVVIPQDVTNQVYLKNRNVDFKIVKNELSQFGFSGKDIEHAVFRWSFLKGPDFTKEDSGKQTGLSITKQFSDHGTYLVILDVLPQGETTYTLLDTIQIDVVPYRGYHLQKVDIEIKSFMETGKQSQFINRAEGKGLQYLWVIDDKLYKGKEVAHTFNQEYYTDVVIARVIDQNNLMTDTGILAASNKGDLEFTPLQKNSKNITVTKIGNNPSIIYLVLGAAAGILLTSAIIYRRRRK